MTSTKSKEMAPNYHQVCEVLGLEPETELTRLSAGWAEYEKNGPKRRKRSAKAAAKILGTTTRHVRKALMAGPEPKISEQPHFLYNRGRPHKHQPLTEQSRAWLLARNTLRMQAGMSLNARAQDFNFRFPNVKINERDLRGLYRGGGVSHQMMVTRLGGPKLKPYDVQMARLEDLKAKYLQLVKDGYEVFQLDEATFAPNHYKNYAWSPVGKPLEKIRRYDPGKVIAVMGVISPERGLVHLHYKERSCDSDDMVQVMRAVRAKVGPDVKVAIFLDNARIHIS